MITGLIKVRLHSNCSEEIPTHWYQVCSETADMPLERLHHVCFQNLLQPAVDVVASTHETHLAPPGLKRRGLGASRLQKHLPSHFDSTTPVKGPNCNIKSKNKRKITTNSTSCELCSRPAPRVATPGWTPSGCAAGWCPWRPRRRSGCSRCRLRRWSGGTASCPCPGFAPGTFSGWILEPSFDPAEVLHSRSETTTKHVCFPAHHQ